MGSRPPEQESNRFSILDSPDLKRKRGNKKSKSIIQFPELPSINLPHPKFIVLQASDPNKSLSQYSCFALHKAIKLISKDVQSISELRDGNLLLLVKNNETAKKFISTKHLTGICEINAKFHEALNSVKGTIFAPFLNNVTVEEIVEELKPIGVTAAYKFIKTVDGKQCPSGVILLTFELYHLPTTINVAWKKLSVRQYIPSPMRCKSCQLLGHTIKYCKRSPACVQCNLPPHAPSECTRILCANCSDIHPASSNKCPKYIQAKEIVEYLLIYTTVNSNR